MNIDHITRRIITANDARLDGTITRTEHATIIAECDRIITANGYTWQDINDHFNQ